MGWKIFGYSVLVGVIIVGCTLIFGTCNLASKMVANGQQTVYEQFSPSVLLAKYEWFKDASAQLDAKVANMGDYTQRFKDLRDAYGSDSLHRSKWSRADMEQWNLWSSELAGVKASYNDLAGQYNAAMVKFNYRFCNVGNLPQGATIALPKEYKPYQ